ncbi:AAA family ATPase [Rhizobium leguminosarum]|uniref:bifunctional aminoglycoside phosphotransferase/ATP-binding protein n=1 Tax=Rhizobium leguminosarum TaxID=384 RepID=UPI001AE7095F|nr:bifunctional aminoglycoside phosphotransferase/ATP-binding protein [Rhizobium leguminosarum]MBP2445086.1 aminoglycoside phosphotransferase family enzyme/predicted kinase [Rhizobium leguminosarum]
MITEDQSSTVSFLLKALSSGTGKVETVETHISRIFLVGDRAYKMKKAVELPYANFSTPAVRLATCRKEVELNRATAPDLYLGVRTINRQADGQLALDGQGKLVDALVEMLRFDQSSLLDRLATDQRLTAPMMTELAREIARFHRSAPIVRDRSGTSNMEAVLRINDAGFAMSSVFARHEVAKLAQGLESRLSELSGVLDKRQDAGKVRRCHGDLHLRNIFLDAGLPCIFDCIEFNENIATSDVLYDLAFLLMDLWHRGYFQFANLIMNRYLDDTDEDDGFGVLPFFLAVRAAVRAHVVALQAEGAEGGTFALANEARSYFNLASSLLKQPPAELVAIGGLSGSGKTTLAEALAPHLGAPPGARIIESDRIRKALFGVPAETRLPPAAYKEDISAKVYREMTFRACIILGEGGTAVTDAVFDNAANRRMMEAAGREGGHRFSGFWLQAEPVVLWQRVATRSGGPSDATLDVLADQLARETAETGWLKLDAALSTDRLVDQLLNVLEIDKDVAPLGNGDG